MRLVNDTDLTSKKNDLADSEERLPDSNANSERMVNIVTHATGANTTGTQFNDKLDIHKSVQTDPEIFFNYIFDFLNALEAKISSGEISVEEVLERGDYIL